MTKGYYKYWVYHQEQNKNKDNYKRTNGNPQTIISVFPHSRNKHSPHTICLPSLPDSLTIQTFSLTVGPSLGSYTSHHTRASFSSPPTILQYNRWPKTIHPPNWIIKTIFYAHFLEKPEHPKAISTRFPQKNVSYFQN